MLRCGGGVMCCEQCCCDGNNITNITISHVTVTGTGSAGGAGNAGLQLTLYTYSARWLTEVSLSLTKSTLGIYQLPTTHTNRNILHSHYVTLNTTQYTRHYTLHSPHSSREAGISRHNWQRQGHHHHHHHHHNNHRHHDPLHQPPLPPALLHVWSGGGLEILFWPKSNSLQSTVIDSVWTTSGDFGPARSQSPC